MLKHWLLACTVAMVPSLALAQDAASAAPETTPAPQATAMDSASAAPMTCAQAHAAMPPGARLDVFDPDAPLERRQAALAAFEQAAALEGCPEFDYVLGMLYRHGPYLPGNLLPQDIEKARALIAPMAEAGDLQAFADMAEMEMRHANSREAMRWTQLYLHFVKTVAMDFARDPEQVRFMNAAYNSNLLARTELIWRYTRPKLSRKLIGEDLNAWLKAHPGVAERMRARMTQGEPDAAGGVATLEQDPGDCYVTLPTGMGAAAATWLLEVWPSGKVGRVVMENFVPKPEIANQMLHCVHEHRFQPFAGTDPVTVRLPMVVGSSEARPLRRR